MAYTTTTGAGVTKNNRSTILNGGNIVASEINNLELVDNNTMQEYASKPFKAVSPASSGNIGTAACIDARVFGGMQEGKYVAKIIGDTLAGVADDVLQGGGSPPGIIFYPVAKISERRYDMVSWDYVTGELTKGANAGVSYDFKEARGSGVIDRAAHPTATDVGQLVFKTGAATPQFENYDVTYNR